MASSTVRALHSISTHWIMDVPLQDWDRSANCRHFPFLPWTSDKQPEKPEMAQMTEVCRNCPVRRDCSKFALGNRDLCGVYAGVYLSWWNPIREARSIWHRQRAKLLEQLLAETPGDEL